MVQENGPGAGTKVFLKDHEEVKDDGANESRVLKNGISEEYIAKICKWKVFTFRIRGVKIGRKFNDCQETKKNVNHQTPIIIWTLVLPSQLHVINNVQ